MTETEVVHEDEERRLRDRLKSRMEQRRRNSGGDSNGSERARNANSERPDSNDDKDKDEKSGQKRRNRRKRRERRRGNHYSPRMGHGPPPHERYHDPRSHFPPDRRYPYPPAHHRYNPRGPDGRWERHGPPEWRGGPRGPPNAYDWRMAERMGPGRSYDRSPTRRGRSRSRSDSRSVSSRSSSRSRGHDSRSRSSSRSISRSRSRSSDSSRSSRSYSSRSRSRSESRSRSPAGVRDKRSSSERSRSKQARRSPSSDSSCSSKNGKTVVDPAAELTKDQRTVFVSQLVMKADEKDIRRYFGRKVNCKVNDVILLRDKRTGRHKGCAYVELTMLEDVPRAVEVSGKVPDFQRFPILVKGSEAEKNYGSTQPLVTRGALVTGEQKLESQKVYVGNIDASVTQAQLYTLFCPFGQLDKINLQLEPSTGMHKGFAFLSFRDPKDANLSIQTMVGQKLAGKNLKTGWASQTSSIPGVVEVTSKEFPADAASRIQKAHLTLQQMTGAGLMGINPYALAAAAAATTNQAHTKPAASGAGVDIASAAEYAVNAAFGMDSNEQTTETQIPLKFADPKKVGNDESPSKFILVHNMFDKDEETEDGWEQYLKEDFEEECSKHGKINGVIVMAKEPGGKVYASFETLEGSQACAEDLAGRWFDKRQLRVEFVDESAFGAGAAN